MIILPMAGLSQRFLKAGYTLPKYMLPLGTQTVFTYVLRSFEAYFDKEEFLFICRDIANTPRFITDQCQEIGIKYSRTVVLSGPTQGQAETVYLGVKQAHISSSAPITIFNIDTLRPDFRFPEAHILAKIDGYLEVFRGQGDAWSFAKTISPFDRRVTETSEKKRISELCSTGLYYFARAHDFMSAFEMERDRPQENWDAEELYVAPLYNTLIREGKTIIAVEILTNKLIPCGVPSEYEALRLQHSQ